MSTGQCDLGNGSIEILLSDDSKLYQVNNQVGDKGLNRTYQDSILKIQLPTKGLATSWEHNFVGVKIFNVWVSRG